MTVLELFRLFENVHPKNCKKRWFETSSTSLMMSLNAQKPCGFQIWEAVVVVNFIPGKRTAMEDSKQSLQSITKQFVTHSVVAYGVFSAIQVFYRFFVGWRRSSHMMEVLKDMPATSGEGHDAPAGWIKDLRANVDRIHDWRLETCIGQPISKNLGFSWSQPHTLCWPLIQRLCVIF